MEGMKHFIFNTQKESNKRKHRDKQIQVNFAAEPCSSSTVNITADSFSSEEGCK